MNYREEQLELFDRKAYEIRRHIIMTIIHHGEGHGGPALSCADILSVLFFGVMRIDLNDLKNPDNDKFLLSAGHKCLALYGALAAKGIIDSAVLETYNSLHSPVPGHPDMKKLPGVDFSSGSLGHGLPIGCGFAKAAKLRGKSCKTYVVMGDGEQGEGSVWEGATFAAHHKLDNLVAFVDRNGLQINGTTGEVMNTAPLEERYRAFGWAVRTVDGHNVGEIYDAVCAAPFENGKPSMIICNTIKSKGLPFAEGNVNYHHWHPGKEEAELAIAALKEYAAARRWTE